MDLILWRHAEAQDKREDLPDLERALTRRGEKQAARVGAWLCARIPGDTRILCSPALRCQQTALALARRFEVHADLGPDAPVSALLAAAHWPGSRHPVLIVGHQPALGDILARLLAMQAGNCAVEKAAVWWLLTGGRDGQDQTLVRTVQCTEMV